MDEEVCQLHRLPTHILHGDLQHGLYADLQGEYNRCQISVLLAPSSSCDEVVKQLGRSSERRLRLMHHDMSFRGQLSTIDAA